MKNHVQGLCDEVRKKEGYEAYVKILEKHQDDFYNSTAFNDNPSDEIQSQDTTDLHKMRMISPYSNDLKPSTSNQTTIHPTTPT